jgi:hypothetical protein
VQNQVAHLAKNSDENVLIGKLQWAPTPGEPKRENWSEERKEDWLEAVSESGEVYYWNVNTRATRWKK